MIGSAEEIGGGCSANAENAKYQLQKAAGDADQALKDWLHYCSPDADLIVKFTNEIQKAKADPNIKSSSQTASPPLAPTQKSQKTKTELVGTFAQSGRLTYDDRSGYLDWDHNLVIRDDGTAEMKTKLKVNLFPGWSLTGCERGSRSASTVLIQKFAVTRSGARVSLDRQGSLEVSRAEPSCWEYSQEYFETGLFQNPWELDWIDGHLKNQDGEYYRQD